MVEGSEVGTEIRHGEKGEFCLFHEDLRFADMICVSQEEVLRTANIKDGGTKGHDVYAIYGGDKIVTSFVPTKLMGFMREENEAKIVLVRKKPYIISGE